MNTLYDTHNLIKNLTKATKNFRMHIMKYNNIKPNTTNINLCNQLRKNLIQLDFSQHSQQGKEIVFLENDFYVPH